jgi:hypothetical protein
MINSLAPTKIKLFKQQRSTTLKRPLCGQNQETDQHASQLSSRAKKDKVKKVLALINEIKIQDT